ncbi:MAG: Holliday junction resolvase RecU [Bacilli bacterium]|nr:Holliday junction resolvase RecU [Acholeplasmataceae bacterium]
MKIKYPNGAPYNPQKIITKSKFNIKKSKLGTSFEKAINESNEFYLLTNRAIIHKKPTPIKITKVDYPKRSAAKITEAFYQTPSTTDYNGIYRGRYIDFEAKSCQTSSFPFSHLYTHQINHLAKVHEHGGISFLLIEFHLAEEVYLLPTPLLLTCYEDSLNGGRKSIPYSYFKEYGLLVSIGFQPRINYLDVVDKVYFKEKDKV